MAFQLRREELGHRTWAAMGYQIGFFGIPEVEFEFDNEEHQLITVGLAQQALDAIANGGGYHKGFEYNRNSRTHRRWLDITYILGIFGIVEGGNNNEARARDHVLTQSAESEQLQNSYKQPKTSLALSDYNHSKVHLKAISPPSSTMPWPRTVR
jgi:hypothetical protein